MVNATDEEGLTLIHLILASKPNKESANMIKILAPLNKNPNSPNSMGVTPMGVAAMEGHLDVVQSLVPFFTNANAEESSGFSPIQLAVMQGHTEIVKLLAPLCDNYLFNNKDGNQASNLIHLAIIFQDQKPEIIEILAPYMDNPNAPYRNGLTPIEMAQNQGLDDIVKILKKTQESKGSL